VRPRLGRDATLELGLDPVVADGRERIVPRRSLIASWFTDPGDRKPRMGFEAVA
jgi:hypothetical protein